MTSFQAHKFTQEEIASMRGGRQTQFHVLVQGESAAINLDGVVEFRKTSSYGQFTGYNSSGCVVIPRMSSPYSVMDTVYAYCGSDEGLYADLQIRDVNLVRRPDANKKPVWC